MSGSGVLAGGGALTPQNMALPWKKPWSTEVDRKSRWLHQFRIDGAETKVKTTGPERTLPKEGAGSQSGIVIPSSTTSTGLFPQH